MWVYIHIYRYTLHNSFCFIHWDLCFFSRWWVAAFFFPKRSPLLGGKKRPFFDLICCHRLVLDPFPWKRLNARGVGFSSWIREMDARGGWVESEWSEIKQNSNRSLSMIRKRKPLKMINKRQKKLSFNFSFSGFSLGFSSFSLLNGWLK